MNVVEQCAAGIIELSSLFRLKEFKKLLFHLFHQEHSQSVTMDSLKSYLDTNAKEQAFTTAEITAAVDVMSDENAIMLSNDIIFLI